MSDDDQSRLADAQCRADAILRRCRERVATQSIPVEVVEAEMLFSGETVILYFLGSATARLGPLSVELGTEFEEVHIQFQPYDGNA